MIRRLFSAVGYHVGRALERLLGGPTAVDWQQPSHCRIVSDPDPDGWLREQAEMNLPGGAP